MLVTSLRVVAVVATVVSKTVTGTGVIAFVVGICWVRFVFASPLEVVTGNVVSGTIKITHKTKKALMSDASFEGTPFCH